MSVACVTRRTASSTRRLMYCCAGRQKAFSYRYLLKVLLLQCHNESLRRGVVAYRGARARACVCCQFDLVVHTVFWLLHTRCSERPAKIPHWMYCQPSSRKRRSIPQHGMLFPTCDHSGLCLPVCLSIIMSVCLSLSVSLSLPLPSPPLISDCSFSPTHTESSWMECTCTQAAAAPQSGS